MSLVHLFILTCISLAMNQALAQQMPRELTDKEKALISELKEQGLIRPTNFVPIKKGKFVLGCDPQKETPSDCYWSYIAVEISKDFEMQDTEVTQLQWFEVMGTTPSRFSQSENCPGNYIEELKICPNHPVETISWNEVADPKDPNSFLSRLNQKNDGYTYRLPTEAEWEYAARARSDTTYFCGNNPSCLLGYGVFVQNNPGNQPADVGSVLPNPWGLYDMSGNVYEWVQDWFEKYPGNKRAIHKDPQGPKSGDTRSMRGGAWSNTTIILRSAYRNFGDPSRHRNDILGFRLVRVPK